MRKNELALPDPEELIIPEAVPEVEPDTLPDGTILRYIVEDSGMNYPDRGLFLAPGYDYEVGEDLDGELAHKLVHRGFVAVYTPEPVKADTQVKEPPATEEQVAPENRDPSAVALMKSRLLAQQQSAAASVAQAEESAQA